MIARGDMALPVITSVIQNYATPIGEWVMTTVNGSATLTMSADGNALEAGNFVTIPNPSGAGPNNVNQAIVLELVLRAEPAASGESSYEAGGQLGATATLAAGALEADGAWLIAVANEPTATLEPAAFDPAYLTYDAGMNTIWLQAGDGEYHVPVSKDGSDYYIKLVVGGGSALRKAAARRSNVASTGYNGYEAAFNANADVNALAEGDLFFYAWLRTDANGVPSMSFMAPVQGAISVDMSFVNNVGPKRYVVPQMTIYAIDTQLTTTEDLVFPANGLNGARWSALFDTSIDALSNDTIMGVERLTYMRGGQFPEFDLGAQAPAFPTIALSQAALAITATSVPLLTQAFVGPDVNYVAYGYKYNDTRRTTNALAQHAGVGSEAHEWAQIDRPADSDNFFFPNTHNIYVNDVVYARTSDGQEASITITIEDVLMLDAIMHTFTTFSGAYAGAGGAALRTARSSDLLFSARASTAAKKSVAGAARKASKTRSSGGGGLGLRGVDSGFAGTTRK
jgi:hypothetical protein